MLSYFDIMLARLNCCGPTFAIRVFLAMVWVGHSNMKWVMVSGVGRAFWASWQDGQALV